MSIQASIRLGGSWVEAPVLLDSSTEVSLIYLRLLSLQELRSLEDYIAVSALFNTTIIPRRSCDLLIKVRDIFSIESHKRVHFIIADIDELPMILGFL